MMNGKTQETKRTPYVILDMARYEKLQKILKYMKFSDWIRLKIDLETVPNDIEEAL